MTSNQNSPVIKPGSAKSPLFFGWYVVAAVTFIAFVNTGSRSSFGIFVIPMSEEFGWNRLTISSVAALGAIVGGAAQPFLGSLCVLFLPLCVCVSLCVCVFLSVCEC